MSLDQLVSVDISVSATAPSAANFGVPMIAAFHNYWPQLLRYYSDLAGLVSDGFPVTHPAYLAASEVMDQNPTVTQFAIGRRAVGTTQVIHLLQSSASALDTYAFNVTGWDGVVHDITQASTGVAATDTTSIKNQFVAPTTMLGASNTGNLVCTAGVAATGVSGLLTVTITTLGAEGTAVFKWSLGSQSASGVTTGTANSLGTTGVTLDFVSGATSAAVGDVYTWNIITNVGTVSSSSATLTFTSSTAGELINIDTWGLPGHAGAPIIALTDASTDPGIAADLAAIYGYNQGWYGVALDSNSAAEIEAAAAWVEANGPHVMCANTSDAAAIGSGASVFTVLQADSYARTLAVFNGSKLLSYAGAALLGKILPLTPGSYTPAYKTLVGVPSDPSSILTGSAVTNITNANGNYYTTFKSIAVLISGITPSGEFLDTTIFIDWLRDAIQTAEFTLLTNNLKIAYTDGGVAQAVNVLKGVLGQGTQVGGLAASPAPTVSAPTVASIALANVAKRNLPNLTFAATLAGAIQSMDIVGSVSLP